MRYLALAGLLLWIGSCKSRSPSSASLADAPSESTMSPTPVDFSVSPGCRDQDQAPARSLEDREIRIATYNVENLFDFKPDDGKNDAEYLDGELYPEEKERRCNQLANHRIRRCLEATWNATLLNRKIDLLEQAMMTQYGSRENFPEILVLTEVENPWAATELGRRLGYITGGTAPTQPLKDHNHWRADPVQKCQAIPYKGMVMTNSPDKRGIDIVALYKTRFGQNRYLTFKKCTEHFVDTGEDYPTRNVLAAEFLVDRRYPLVVFGNHWPSQAGRDPANRGRGQAAQVLKTAMESYPAGTATIATGDFNVSPTDSPHAVHDVATAGGTIQDAETEFVRQFGEDKSKPGSYYYGPKAAWYHFDRFLFSKDMRTESNAIQVRLEDYRTHSHLALQTEKVFTIFRNDAAADLYERATGEEVRYRNMVETTLNPRLKALFADDPSIGIARVVESCAPKRIWKKENEAGEIQMNGFSDHFGSSIVVTVK